MRELLPYLPRVYQEDVKQWGVNMPAGGYPNGGDRGYRADSWPQDGYAGSSVDLMREQLLDRYHVEYAVLLGQELRPLGTLPDADYAAALRSEEHTSELQSR